MSTIAKIKMKNLLLIICLMVSGSTYAQQADPLVKKIEVTGKAEMEIIPDEIFIRIALKEYKDGSKKVAMDKLEAQLVKAVNQLNIPESNLSVDNIYGNNWDYRKKKSDEFLATKSFRLKVSDVKMMNNLIDKLDAEGVNNISVAEVSHSKIEEYTKQLRLEALKAAKTKAEYLLEGIGEKLGSALEINEISHGSPMPYANRAVSNTMYSMSESEDYSSDMDFKTISLEAQIRAVFEIK